MRIRFWKWSIAGVAMLGILAAATLAPALGAYTDDSDPAELAVRATLQHYLDGHAAGRGDVMAPAFTASARISAVTDGTLRIRDIDEFLDAFAGRVADDEADRRRWIQSVDVVGDMALAKVILLYPGVRFVDYMLLHQVNGEWKIVHKAYHAEQR